MSNLSNDQGRALEFSTLMVFEKEISEYRSVKIDKNSSFESAKKAWDKMSPQLKETFEKCAIAAAKVIFDLEPIILENGNDTLELKIQPDQAGKIGDVRDILIIRAGMKWEIGLSIKHNHLAVKHSRLGSTLDFGKSWFDVNCSAQYWNDVKPVFDRLALEKKKGSKWSDLSLKETVVYTPILQAFVDEIKRSYAIHGKIIPIRMIEYLLGRYDFYKVIGIDREKCTKVQAFNLRGSLNLKSKQKRSVCIVPLVNLPNRIVNIGIKPGSNTTVELYLDQGWQFGFRIHNASTLVENSLKFDIQIIGMPATILTIDKYWS